MDVHTSLYKKFIDGSYFCFLQVNATSQDYSESSELDCTELDESSAECNALETAQNSAAVSLFILSSTVLLLLGGFHFKERVTEVNNFLIAVLAAVFISMICSFICAGSYKTYLEGVSTVTVNIEDASGQSTEIGTIDVSWTYGYSWVLMVMSGVSCIFLFGATAYLFFTDFFNDKKQNRRASSTAEDIHLPAITNALGVPLVPEQDRDDLSGKLSSKYEL